VGYRISKRLRQTEAGTKLVQYHSAGLTVITWRSNTALHLEIVPILVATKDKDSTQPSPPSIAHVPQASFWTAAMMRNGEVGVSQQSFCTPARNSMRGRACRLPFLGYTDCLDKYKGVPTPDGLVSVMRRTAPKGCTDSYAVQVRTRIVSKAAGAKLVIHIRLYAILHGN
jgi:hypothetical protein